MALRRGRSTATGFLRDFQEFIMRGNFIDLTVAVIVGGAFTKIIESLVTDVITPLLLTPALQAAKVEDLNKLSFNNILYGKFVATVINFLMVAFIIYIVIKVLEAFRRKKEAEVAAELEVVDLNALAQERLIEALDRLTQVLESQAHQPPGEEV
ncbi:MAG: large conductance mechanosensitive channel protein MscL [Pseudanabaenaceae cyanobacterium]